MRRLDREREATVEAIRFGEDSLKHMPLTENEVRQVKERIEQLRFDLRMIGHDERYYTSY